MPPKPLEPGDPLRLGRFELLGRLGEGGQGIVYLGRGTNPGEDRVAVKVLRSTVDATVLERLARELDAIHQVQPFVTAGVIEASAEGDRRFVVSEFIDGPSLQERVDARGPLPEGDLQRLAVGTATALTAIHGAGVVHRDFKPANVLLGPDGPRVVDFGIARLTDAATITSGLIGTPSYVTPEQLAGERPTSAVDVFAWALTMIFAATGRLAFGADSVPAVMHRIMYEEPDLSGLPPSLRPIVRECLAKDPARRPSARDLLLRLVDPSAQRTPLASTGPAVPVDSVPHTGPLPYPEFAVLHRLTASAGRAHDLRARADPGIERQPEEHHHLHVRGWRADRAGEQPGLRQHPHVDRGNGHGSHLQRAADRAVRRRDGDVHAPGRQPGLPLDGQHRAECRHVAQELTPGRRTRTVRHRVMGLTPAGPRSPRRHGLTRQLAIPLAAVPPIGPASGTP